MFELDLEPGFNKQEFGVADKAVFYKKGSIDRYSKNYT